MFGACWTGLMSIILCPENGGYANMTSFVMTSYYIKVMDWQSSESPGVDLFKKVWCSGCGKTVIKKSFCCFGQTMWRNVLLLKCIIDCFSSGRLWKAGSKIKPYSRVITSLYVTSGLEFIDRMLKRQRCIALYSLPSTWMQFSYPCELCLMIYIDYV